ncbi:MAG: tRNA (adenosine(37)-N6)-dimethylallyltransferase MiaA [Firmicutes bacterium]|nr:tRNA (adenosine(37)-N6)-dimethylallyltransferase MiaA [Bacillota bacterium]
MERQKTLVLVGPTAVGKTELSIRLAEELQAEIISADSMQVYRGMDIGTAKPTLAERQRVPHHLLDVVDPDESFNVADYVALAAEVLARLRADRTTPLLTGGTGLYIDALLDGFLFPDAPADPSIRQELEEQGAKDPASLYAQLQEVDPVSAARLHPHDLRRIIRALEVYRRTGEAISALQQKREQQQSPYDPLYIGLTRDRQELYARINLRVDLMLEQGLVEEVADLLAQYPQQPTALQALGYKEIASYLRGELSLEEAVELLKRDTRRYAKRQLSWFTRNKRIHWFNRTNGDDQELFQTILELWESFLLERQ